MKILRKKSRNVCRNINNVAIILRAIIGQTNLNASRVFPLFFILSSGDLCGNWKFYKILEESKGFFKNANKIFLFIEAFSKILMIHYKRTSY